MFYFMFICVDFNFELYGDLVEDWLLNDVFDEWMFMLCEVMFYDGSLVIVVDVKVMFDMVYDEEVGSFGMGMMGDI